MPTNIVVSRYGNKNVDFAYRFNEGKDTNVLIYEKEKPECKYNIPVNKGNEASAYLKYIIDFYDELPEYTFFVHDDDYSWHHSGSIVPKYAEAVESGQLYYNINDRSVASVSVILTSAYIDGFRKWYAEFMEDIVPFSSLNLETQWRYSAQFLVHKSLIRKIPKEWYEKCYNWILTDPLPGGISGTYMEWVWNILWVVYTG